MYYLVRRNGRLIKVWKPDPTATEAIDRAYVDVFGRPAPDNWREGLAHIVAAARAGAPRLQPAGAVGTIASQIAVAMLREELAFETIDPARWLKLVQFGARSAPNEKLLQSLKSAPAILDWRR